MSSNTSWKPKAGDKGKTREGDDYQVLVVTDLVGPGNENVVAIVANELKLYFADGKFYSDQSCGADLMPPPKTLWLNVYSDDRVVVWDTENEAKANANRECAVLIAHPLEVPRSKKG